MRQEVASHATAHTEGQTTAESGCLFRLHKVNISLPGHFEDFKGASVHTLCLSSAIETASYTPLWEPDAEAHFCLCFVLRVNLELTEQIELAAGSAHHAEGKLFLLMNWREREQECILPMVHPSRVVEHASAMLRLNK